MFLLGKIGQRIVQSFFTAYCIAAVAFEDFGILIPTDVGLLIQTTQCHAFGTVKNGKNALRAQLRYLENSDQCSSFYA